MSSEFKGTPGPWRAAIRRGYVAVMAGPQVATKAIADCRTVDTEYPESVANCHLIAAAPDLLEACQFVLDNAGGPPVDMLSKIRAAVRKALGE